MIAVALLALAVDLVLRPQSARRGLTVAVALGCLLAAGMAGWQWHTATGTAPGFVQGQVAEMAQRAAGQLRQHAADTSPEYPASFLEIAEADDIIEMLHVHAKQGVAWPYQQLTVRQVRQLLRAGRQTEASSDRQARDMVATYQTLRQEKAFSSLPAVEMGLGQPGVGVWWFFAHDRFAAAFKLIFALAAGLVLLLAVRYPVERYRGEFAAMLCFAAAGLMVMVTSLDLIVLFLGLELAALSCYALAAWRKDDARAAEAGTKYLLLGSLASAFYIYGASLIFVQMGTTHLVRLSNMTLEPKALAVAGMLLLLIAFAFKIAAAPFHLWAPDVYQGAPTSVAAFLSTASKAAGFAVLVRIFTLGFITLTPQWVALAGLLAVASLLVGNLVAVHQNNVKRMLAYSGIAQAGYLLIAVVAMGGATLHASTQPILGPTALVLYLFLYTVGNIGAFAIVGIVERDTGSSEAQAFAGLRTRAPLLAFTMLLLLLSLGGIPLLAGFVGKWYLFMAGVVEGQYVIVLLGAALSVVAIYYYLLVAKQMYILEAPADAAPIRTGALAGISLFAITALTVMIGVWPGPFLQAAEMTARALLGQ